LAVTAAAVVTAMHYRYHTKRKGTAAEKMPGLPVPEKCKDSFGSRNLPRQWKPESVAIAITTAAVHSHSPGSTKNGSPVAMPKHRPLKLVSVPQSSLVAAALRSCKTRTTVEGWVAANIVTRQVLIDTVDSPCCRCLQWTPESVVETRVP
jgi:hypothetical protein